RRRHTRWPRDWSSDVCSSDLKPRDPLELRKNQQADEAETADKHPRRLGRHAPACEWPKPGALDLPVEVAVDDIIIDAAGAAHGRSEERRVGRGGRRWCWPDK